MTELASEMIMRDGLPENGNVLPPRSLPAIYPNIFADKKKKNSFPSFRQLGPAKSNVFYWQNKHLIAG